MEEIYYPIRFYEAKTLIEFIKKHADIINREHINAIYTPDPAIIVADTASGGTKYETDQSMVIEFDTFVVVFDYFIYSDLQLLILDKKAFYDGELTPELLGWLQVPSDPFPYEKNTALSCLEQRTLTDVIVGRFSDEFEINSSTGCIRPEGGDYFASLFLMVGDIGVRICAEDTTSDGFMDIEIVTEKEIEHVKEISGCSYERISIAQD